MAARLLLRDAVCLAAHSIVRCCVRQMLLNPITGVKCKLALHGMECIAHLMIICSRAATGSLRQGMVTPKNAVDVVRDRI